MDKQLLKKKKNFNLSHNNSFFSTLSKEVFFEEERLTISLTMTKTLEHFTNLVCQQEH